MGHHAGISSANTRSVPTASATAKISCAYARPVQVNMVASNPGVLYRELRPPLDSGCDRHHKICDWYRVRAMPPGRVHRDQSYSAARRCVRLRSTRCPLLAQSRHEPVHRTRPLLGVKRTSNAKILARNRKTEPVPACFCALRDEPVAQVKRQNRRDHGRGISHDNRIDHSSPRIP